MAHQLLDQTEFDAIVLGTGLTEAIIAGALARSGRSVLHLDQNDFYGSNWSAINFKDLWAWCQADRQGRDDAPLQNGILEDDPNQHLLVHFEENCRKNFKHIEYDIYARDPPAPQPTEPDSSPPPSSEPQPVDVNSNSTSDHQPSDDPVPIPDTTTNPTTDLTTDTPIPSLTLITLDLSGLSNSPSTSPPTPTTLTTTLTTHLRAFLPSPTSPTPSELLAIEHESRLLHLALPPTSSATLDLAPHVGRIRTLADLLTASRQYIIDFAPKVLLCRGQLVETLISSGVSRYLEFKGVEKSFIFEGEGGGVFEKVPISKEDIFTNKSISLIDKRKLMKFLTFALEYEASPEVYDGYDTKPYADFLQEKFKIDGRLLRAVLYSIALSSVEDEDVNTIDGLARTSSFLKSLGRFGNYAFLYPLYGGGSEIAQAFCRVCAVYGGIYMLNHPIRELLVAKDSGEFVGLVDDNGQTLKSKWLIVAPDYVPDEWVAGRELGWQWISRAIVITDAPAYGHGDGSEVTQTVFPPRSVGGNRYPITMLQLNHGTQACPAGQYLLYFNTKSEGNDRTAREELVDAVRKVVRLPPETASEDDPRRAPLFTLFYHQRIRTADSFLDPAHPALPSNVLPCGDPNAQVDYGHAMNEARAWFLKCCPGEEDGFLPAPEVSPEEEEEVLG